MGRKIKTEKNDDYKDWIVEVFADEQQKQRIKTTLYSSGQKIADDLELPLSKVYNHAYGRVKPANNLKFIRITKTNNIGSEDLEGILVEL